MERPSPADLADAARRFLAPLLDALAAFPQESAAARAGAACRSVAASLEEDLAPALARDAVLARRVSELEGALMHAELALANAGQAPTPANVARACERRDRALLQARALLRSLDAAAGIAVAPSSAQRRQLARQLLAEGASAEAALLVLGGEPEDAQLALRAWAALDAAEAEATRLPADGVRSRKR